MYKPHLPASARKTNILYRVYIESFLRLQLGVWKRICLMLHFTERQSLEARSLAFQHYLI